MKLYPLIALALFGCAPTFVAPGHAERAALSQELDPSLLRGAIVQTLNAQRHAITADADGLIRATLSSGGANLQVEIPYDGRGYALQSIGAQGFDTTVDPQTGSMLVSSRYIRWMQKLRRLIDREILVVLEARRELEEDMREAVVDTAEAQRDAELAALERERLARTPVPAQPQYQAQYQAQPQLQPGQSPQPAPLQGGFNITQAPNGLGPARLIVINEAANPFHGLALRGGGSRQWRENQLRRTVPTGASYEINNVPPGSWEVRVETQAAYKEWRHLRFESGGVYTLVVTTQGWYRL